jgi:hypothetical protein
MIKIWMWWVSKAKDTNKIISHIQDSTSSTMIYQLLYTRKVTSYKIIISHSLFLVNKAFNSSKRSSKLSISINHSQILVEMSSITQKYLQSILNLTIKLIAPSN